MIIAALLIINQEMETTHSSRLPDEADGPKGPLLLPKLQFLMEFRWRREVKGRFDGRHTQLSTKKDAQHKSCKLSFIWGKMRTVDWERASKIAGKLLQRGNGQGQYVRLWWRESSKPSSSHFTKGFLLARGADVTMKGFSAFLDKRRFKDWDQEISSWK